MKNFPSSLLEMLSHAPRTILYFYPKDSTPGCTLEAQDFTRLQDQFEKLGIQVIGVSQDSDESHTKFRDTCHIAIPLLSDESGALHERFCVIGEKKLYGKTYMGVIRSTFLLDTTGKILREWRNVKAKGHAEKVLEAVSNRIEATE